MVIIISGATSTAAVIQRGPATAPTQKSISGALDAAGRQNAKIIKRRPTITVYYLLAVAALWYD